MTRTRRIYNNPNLKKTIRNDLTKTDGKMFSEMSEGEMAEYLNDSLRNSISFKGFLFHPYASGLCMGRCPHCRDPTEDQKHLRKVRKREFQSLVKMELTSEEGVPEELPAELDGEKIE